MQVCFLDFLQNDKIIFTGTDYIPRLDDFVRHQKNTYKVIGVDWVYPDGGGKPMHVEILLVPK